MAKLGTTPIYANSNFGSYHHLLPSRPTVEHAVEDHYSYCHHKYAARQLCWEFVDNVSLSCLIGTMVISSDHDLDVQKVTICCVSWLTFWQNHIRYFFYIHFPVKRRRAATRHPKPYKSHYHPRNLGSWAPLVVEIFAQHFAPKTRRWRFGIYLRIQEGCDWGADETGWGYVYRRSRQLPQSSTSGQTWNRAIRSEHCPSLCG